MFKFLKHGTGSKDTHAFYNFSTFIVDDSAKHLITFNVNEF